MKSYQFVFISALIVFINISFTKAIDPIIRIGFIGNSITIGTGLSNPETECYPAQIGLLLKEKYGDTCEVKNFAVSGRTMLKKGDYPIWNEIDFTYAYNYAPDILFICLGTNDTKPQNWDSYGNEFISDYKSMIDTFLVRNPNTKFVVCYPPPAFAVQWGIRNEFIVSGVIPAVDSIIKLTGADLVDFYHTFLDSSYLFPDYIHPNAKGAKVMAKVAFDQMEQAHVIQKADTGNTFATSLKSNRKGDIRLGDTAVISWSTANAIEVLLNGQNVEKNGSMTVKPTITTTYVLKAIGKNSTDSLSIVQKVYIPELEKILLLPTKKKIKKGDTIQITASFFDQKNYIMKDSIYEVSWSIEEGKGRLINQGVKQIQLIADSAGTIKVQAEAKGKIGNITITVTEPVDVKVSSQLPFTIYPNPVSKIAFIKINNKAKTYEISISDMLGRKCIYQKNQVKNLNNVEIDFSSLKSGIYFYNIIIDNQRYTGKIIKE